MNNFGIDMTGEIADVEPTKPPVDLDPIEYVQHIRKINPGNNGRPIDIRNARQMTRSDLLAANPRDLELLLVYGVSQPQIARIYNVPAGSIGKILRDIGVDTGVKLLVNGKFDQSGHTWHKSKKMDVVPDSGEVITDTDKIAEFMTEPVPEPDDITVLKDNVVINTVDNAGFKAFLDNNENAVKKSYSVPEPTNEFQWFHREQKNQGEPTITVRASGDIYFSTEFGKLFTIGAMIEIGLTPDCSKIAVKNGGTYRLLQCDKTNTSKAISAGNIRDELSWKGVMFPAKYQMSSVDGMWVGELMP